MEAKWRWILITAIAPIAWGSNYFVTRQFLPVDSPLWGAVLRALPAGLILLAIARSRPRGSWWWKSFVLGALNVGAFFVLIYLASQLLPSSVASTIMASSAGVLMLLAWPLLSDRPTLLPAIGAVLGFVGVGVMLLGGGESGGGGGAGGAGGGIDPLGVMASLAAMLMSSVGFILTKKWAVNQKTLAITSWQLLAGGLLVLPFAVLVEGGVPALDGAAMLGFAYVTLVATALAFVAWFSGLRHLPAGTVGLVGLLNPVTGVLLGTLLASEPFGWRQALGTALVLLGVVIGQRRRAASVPPAIIRPRELDGSAPET
jgi:probable blue pigment (indigoidine) exporter